MTTQKALHRTTPNITNCLCHLCKHRWSAKYIKDPRGTRYKIAPPTCSTKNAVYVIHCARCEKNYVGMTVNLKQRFAQHWSSVINRKDTSISNHFNSPDHNVHTDLKLALLDYNIPNRLDLRMREGYWIHLLQTTSRGINKKEECSTILEYQTLSAVQHFRHSKSCFPYTNFVTEKIESLTNISPSPATEEKL